MKVLSLSDFKNCIEDLKPHSYVFDSANQTNNTYRSTLRILSEYKTVLISFAPNIICFKNESSSICFERVKRIYMKRTFQRNQTEFEIICGSKLDSHSDISYSVVAE